MTRTLIAAALGLALGASAAHAAPAVYTISGAWNGTLNGVTFNDANFTLTMVGDTNQISQVGDTEFLNFLQSSTIAIDGFAPVTFLEPTSINTDTNPLSGETTFDHFTPSTRNTFIFNLQHSVDLRHSFAPVQSSLSEIIPDLIPTSGGGLQFQIVVGGPVLTFAGEVREGAAPEPASWAMMLLGFCGAGALLRRRRRELVAAA